MAKWNFFQGYKDGLEFQNKSLEFSLIDWKLKITYSYQSMQKKKAFTKIWHPLMINTQKN